MESVYVLNWITSKIYEKIHFLYVKCAYNMKCDPALSNIV